MTNSPIPFNSVFQLVNKVAGVYGLIAVVTGAGGSFAQLSLYIYSVLALIVFTWGLRRVKEVCRPTFHFCSSRHTIYVFTGGSSSDVQLCAHLFRRPPYLYDVDRLLRCRLVGLAAT